MADSLPFDPTAPKALPEKRKPPIRSDMAHYVGYIMPNGKPLSEGDVRRLVRMEYSNRRRVRDKGPDAIIETVDFIAVCIAQKFLCCICGEGMNPAKRPPKGKAISLEHDPAVSVCREHTKRTVKAAHEHCNWAKNHGQDTPRAAKIKRVQKDEDRHATRMRAKANLSRDAYRKLKHDEAKLHSQNTLSKAFSQLSRHPEGAVNGYGRRGFQKPKDMKFDWKKGRYSKTTG